MANLIKKYDIFSPSLFKDFFEDDIFNDSFFHRRAVPPVNVSEDKDKYLIEVSVPGVEKENIKIVRNNEVLTISYEQKTSSDYKEKNYFKREFQMQSFSRSFNLPADVILDKISSEHKDGVLSISLPKQEVKSVEDVVDIEIK